MIKHLEVTLCQPRRRGPSPETSERILRASPKCFYKHIGRTAGAEQNQHGDCAGFEKRSKPLGYGAKILHAVERCKIGERSIERRFTRQAAFLCEAPNVFARNDLGVRSQRRELLSGNIDHGRRSIREKHAKAAFREKHSIFAGASTNFEYDAFRRKLLQKSSPHCPSLCRDACPATKSLVKDCGNRVEGKRCGPK